ncbi:MAG: CFI-box-CTERM domain-containing protein [Candidatus Omnitrophota bacterium]
MFNLAIAKGERGRLLVKCVSVLLIAALCLGNAASSFAFTSDAKVAFLASVTIGGGGDTDFDGMPDAWETANGLDPNDPDDAYDDNDNDGIRNIEEYYLDTDPNLSNSNIEAVLAPAPAGGLQPLNVTLTASAFGAANPIVRYEWDFDGNGTYDQWHYASEGNSVSYRYTASGTYNANVRITDSEGNAAIGSTTVDVVRNEALSPPTANPELNFADITIPTTLKLNATSFDNNGIALYQWDTTGNGEYDIMHTKSANIIKAYNETRTRSFNASFKVTDYDGLADIAHVGIRTDASDWNSSPNRPKVFVNRRIVYGTAGVPVSLGGYGSPDVGYTKKLEWDFEEDGIYDWSSSIENPDWNGRADVSHTYGAPGIYRAILKIHTEAFLSATDSVLVIISSSGVPPIAQATVSYNGTGPVAAINGEVPVKAVFNHSLSFGGIVKYEWDFDGDKSIDYSTTSPADSPTHDYIHPGYCVASLRVTDINGLIDTFYIPVFAYYPITYASNIKYPTEGKTVAGNAVTIVAEVFPDDVNVQSVMLQYRKEGEAIWNNIGIGIPSLSYIKTWNTTGLDNGSIYELRATVNGVDSSSFKIRSVVVDNFTANPDIYENSDGTIQEKKVKVSAYKYTEIIFPDGTNIYIPEGAIGADDVVTVKQTINAGIGEIKLEITGIDKFLKDITLSITYPDLTNDGIVDGTNPPVHETDLAVAWINDQGEWEQAYDSIVHPDENYVSAKTNHLSFWGLISLIGGGGGGGGISSGFASDGSSVSYCFIATAAYGTGMAQEVAALKSFRDRHLLRNELGREFVDCYYRYSPPIAKFIEDKPGLRALVRFMLKPLVKLARSTLRSGGEAK